MARTTVEVTVGAVDRLPDSSKPEEAINFSQNSLTREQEVQARQKIAQLLDLTQFTEDQYGFSTYIGEVTITETGQIQPKLESQYQSFGM